MWERGIFNLMCIRPAAEILELCCGDGFNAYHFYRCRAKSITAVGIDPIAIAHAQNHFRNNAINFGVSDIRKELPSGKFDNVIWDAAIEHFTEQEITKLIGQIKDRLKVGGILSGHTIVEQSHGKQHQEHEYEFKSMGDLERFLSPHFKNVKVFETQYPGRHNLYFFASDRSIPFDESWGHQLQYQR
jgi:cyclopropane fatty-acyl-phospholipid synthase-like methyltransferase